MSKSLLIIVFTSVVMFGQEKTFFDASTFTSFNNYSNLKDPFGDKPLTRKQKRRIAHYGPKFGELVGSGFKDIFLLHKYLFTWDTFKVISTTFPIFVGARMIDEKLQRCFYDGRYHTNINQMPSWCHTVAKVSIAAPIVFLGSDIFFSKDPDHRWTAQILLLGMPFVIWTKKLVKKLRFECFRRPWHEAFSCEERSYGGFPSGHMAQALYMAVLYGTRYGPAYAVPLGIMSTAIGVTFVTCNRHYLSQIIGGAAFGTLYALAANKVVESNMKDTVKLGLKVDNFGRPSFSFAFKW